MKVGIVGARGFVGSALRRAHPTSHPFTRENISELSGDRFDLVINAGVSSLRWRAEQDPAADRRAIHRLWADLARVRTSHLVHISTADVLPDLRARDESAEIVPSRLGPYGRHRFEVEQLVRQRFPEALIVRLPHLYGLGLRKNFLFDLLHGLDFGATDQRDTFQWYDVDRLWADLTALLEMDLDLVHITAQPLSAVETAWCCGVELSTTCDRPPRRYDLRTAVAYRSSVTCAGYMYCRDEVLAGLASFCSGPGRPEPR